MPAKLDLQKRIAAKLMKCGETRVRFDPERLDDVAEAITREDIKKLIEDGAIYKVQATGVSRVRARKREEKERVRGHGSRKGGRYSRVTRKERWMLKVRVQRKKLKQLREKKLIDASTYRRVYRMVKAGAFKSVSDLISYLEANRLIRRPLI
ncbi:MAG: 50S ribosomal protein L19e [Nitrososphaerota archaeon]